MPVSTTFIAPKTGDPPVLKDLIISENGVELHNIPSVMGKSERMIAEDSRKRKGYSGNEITVNSNEAIDIGLQTLSPKR